MHIDKGKCWQSWIIASFFWWSHLQRVRITSNILVLVSRKQESLIHLLNSPRSRPLSLYTSSNFEGPIYFKKTHTELPSSTSQLDPKGGKWSWLEGLGTEIWETGFQFPNLLDNAKLWKLVQLCYKLTCCQLCCDQEMQCYLELRSG